MRVNHETKTVHLTADDFDAAIFQLRHDPGAPVYIGTIPRGYTLYLPDRITPDCKIALGVSAAEDDIST